MKIDSTPDRINSIVGMALVGKIFQSIGLNLQTRNTPQTVHPFNGRTCKGFDGYAPISSYLGAEGYMLSSELRPV